MANIVLKNENCSQHRGSKAMGNKELLRGEQIQPDSQQELGAEVSQAQVKAH